MNSEHQASHTDLVRHNMGWGIAQGALAEAGKTLADPNMVLALFLRQLGGSHLLVGLLASIRHEGLLLPQLIVASHIETKPKKGPYYVGAELIRSAGYLFIALAIVCLSKPSLVLPVFLVAFLVSHLAHGVGSVPNFDVIGRVVPADQRGSFFARRKLSAGLCGLMAGLAVRQILSAGGTGAPPMSRYAWLIALAALFFALTAATFSRIVEPISTVNRKESVSWSTQLRRAPGLLTANRPFRTLTVTLLLMDVARRLADPFFMIFATEVLHIPVAVAGFYLSALVCSNIASNLFWERLSRYRPNRITLQFSAAAAAVAPAFALAVGFAADSATFAFPEWNTVIAAAFGLVYLVLGFRDSGKFIGKRGVLLDVAPIERLPTYWGLLNTLLGLMGILPLLAGKVVDLVGFQPVFGMAVAAASVSWWFSRRLEAKGALAGA